MKQEIAINVLTIYSVTAIYYSICTLSVVKLWCSLFCLISSVYFYFLLVVQSPSLKTLNFCNLSRAAALDASTFIWHAMCTSVLFVSSFSFLIISIIFCLIYSVFVCSLWVPNDFDAIGCTFVTNSWTQSVQHIWFFFSKRIKFYDF